MDYGYQLLRHVVRQVFGNLKEAAQLTLLLFLVPFIGFVLLWGSLAGLMPGTSGDAAPAAGGILLGGLLLLGVTALAYCWAAVGWHRYVLLEETGNGILPQWHPDRVLSYLGRVILVVLITVLAAIAGGVVVGLVTATTQAGGGTLILWVGLVFGISWVATRIGLILPAAAVGARMTFGESWAATRPVSGQILLPLIVIAIVTVLVDQVILLLFGQTTQVEVFGQIQDQVVPALPGQILNGIAYWLQVLVNLALMTTLYGNLVEGRPLN
ncbi:MAG: hypothetical protein GDA52_10415 [Rhodobacteraceae bacterium]|nr:hypothetical protein [Paracoccaceae bacterium]